DAEAERRALERLLSLEPGHSPALVRLAELLQQADERPAAAALPRRKTDLEHAMDRYFPLYKQDRFAEHLAEMAALAERLGRWFGARAFWELPGSRARANADAGSALARLAPFAAPRRGPPGHLAQVLAADLGPLSSASPSGAARDHAGRGPIPRFED